MIETADEFVRLRTSEVPDEYLRAANDHAPIDVWQAIVTGWPEMRTWVAHNKTVPIEILEVLARDEDPDVRWAVAMKRKLTRAMFDQLAMDPDETVRARIALNRKAPPEVIEQLSHDPISLVSNAAMDRMKEAVSTPDDSE